MENSPMNKYAAGFGLSLVVTSMLNLLVLIIKEKNDTVMSAMKAALGHHWTTHGVIVIILFVVLGFILSAMKLETKLDSEKMRNYIVSAVIISVVVIAGFYLSDLKLAAAIKY